MRRANPRYFTRINSMRLGERTFAAYGNLFLLDRPDCLQVQCSRRITPEALAAEKARLLDAAERGAVLISPCISPGEKEIAHAALDEGLALIVLLENGFPERYKPPGKYFAACEAGKLLMLAPWPYHADKRTITRAQCLALNEMAREIAALHGGRGRPAHVWTGTGLGW